LNLKIEIKSNLNSVEYKIIQNAKKEGLLFSDNIFYFILKDDSSVVGFFGIKYSKDKAIFKCDYVLNDYRGNSFLLKMNIERLRWLKINTKIRKVEANATRMALNSHIKAGASIVKKYKNGITKVNYEIL